MRSASRLKVRKVGIKALEQVGAFIKPTTRLIQIFGHFAEKAVLELEKVSLKRLVEGEPIRTGMDIENGYVILLYKGRALGLGLLIDGTIRSQLPVKEIKISMI